MKSIVPSHLFPLAVAISIVLVLGCDQGVPQFSVNQVFAKKVRLEGPGLKRARGDSMLVLTAAFGTPNNPHVPKSIDRIAVVSEDGILRSSGAVSSDQQGVNHGLFRKHCVQCHGLAGDGAGPASALLNPYPRDFRMGVFKFKSTRNGNKPTRADLIRTIKYGLTGTAMPSFSNLPGEDIEALADYVMFLTMRGEVERSLLRDAADDLDYTDPDHEDKNRLIWIEGKQADSSTYLEQLDRINTYCSDAANRWARANDAVVSIPEYPPPDAESIARGKELFLGKIANCSVCHGPQGRGNGQENDYDDWTKEWSLRMGLDLNDPSKKPAIDEYVQLGAQRPRHILPRDLTRGVFKAGRTPESIYRRIVQGIDGTPMPAVNLVETPSASGLTKAQVWDIVNFVLSVSTGEQDR